MASGSFDAEQQRQNRRLAIGRKVKKRNIKQCKHETWKSRYSMRRRRISNAPKHRPRNRVLRHKSRSILVAPAYFELMTAKSGNGDARVDDFFAFLNRLRSVSEATVQIDMTGVRRMVVDATLLFKAELSRVAQARGVTISAIPPRSVRTQQVLKQTGIDKLLNLKIEVLPDREDVVHWRIAEGPNHLVDPNTLEAIMTDIEEVTGMASHPVYQGIIESMGNCVEHAYKPHPDVTRSMPIDPGWWVFQQVKDNNLTVVVCDLGIGVSRALPLTLAEEPSLLKKLLHVARRARGEDNRALLAAMEYGRTSTKERQRGKGMRNAHAVVDDIGEGEFFAISNRGCYMYVRPRSPGEPKRRTVKLKYSINGTILRWTLPLQSSSTENSA